MARKPRKEGARSKTRGNKGASGRRGASKRPQKRARKTAVKVAKPTKSIRRTSGGSATLKRELNEAKARQAATAEILKIIASSPDDVNPVFEAIVTACARLFRCDRTFIQRCNDATYWAVAAAGRNGPAKIVDRTFRTIDANANFPSRAIVSQRTVHLPDWSAIDLPEHERGIHRQLGIHSALFLPLVHDGRSIGVLGLASKRTNNFDKSDIALAESFRDQALIAVENARLFNETNEALAQQTASSEVLEVISSSPGDLQPVFKSMLNNALRICEAKFGQLLLFDGRGFLAADLHNTPAEYAEIFKRGPLVPGPNTGLGRLIASKRFIHIPDVMSGSLYAEREPLRIATVELLKARTLLAVPMLKDTKLVGAIVIYRQEARPFSDRQIKLVTNFAAQAVIAIENARLFNETKEALARQTATADVLKVIASSPSNLQPVFDAIAERSKELIGAHSTTVVRYFHGVIELAAFTPVTPEADAALRALFPMQPNVDEAQFGLVLRGEVARIADAESEIEDPAMRETARARGWRSRLLVPLKDDTGVIGWISITRKEVGGFADKDVELLETFADQAVIAIQNTELFENVQAKTRDLEESLQQQTATADALKVISRSAFDLDSVMDTLARSALELCAAEGASLFLRDGEMLVCRGTAARDHLSLEPWRGITAEVNNDSHMGRAVLTGTIANIGDFENNPNTKLRKYQQRMGFKAFLAVPLMREGRGVGVFILTRYEVGEFTPRQVELVQTFADQAVIAVENTRLFNETTEALARQTATAEVLKVIASSPSNLQPVFEAIAGRSKELVGAHSTIVVRIVGGMMELAAFTPVSPEADAVLRSLFPRRPADSDPQIAMVLRGEIAEIADAEADHRTSTIKDAARARGWRSQLLVPLKDDAGVIGWISITRKEPGTFAHKDVELLKTFADQAVIAISNVELFQQVQERTRELSQSLDDLRAAQDRLVQTEKLASLGQLTAGIAHEIKNPLNFVNNFSALSVELTDELNDVLKQAQLAEKLQQDVNELTALLKSNLEKVVQHGKRADSIVKNMLLHSREGSGEQRAADINSLVEESLNLAYHGARAEKSGFNITLEREFDASAGSAELFPQEMTRALLNLISNGFYAATRRKAENGEAAFEPTLLARTRNLGGSVEIRIRDNGTGIPPEVKEKMFNPFFTTKPAGEGTGLGLSMTHDIIVKQHGGSIDVATEPGSFTEFIVVLPRANNAHSKSKGQT